MSVMETTVATSSGPRPNAWRELGDLSDDSLVERARQHDLAAFEALMRRHNRRLFRVTRGVLRELMMRRRAPADAVSLDEVGDDALVAEEAAASDAPSADQFVEAAHARALLEHAIDALPDNFRMVFILRAVEGLDVRETAESLGVNLNTVRTRLFRANRLLRGELAKRLHTESTEVFDFGSERCDAVVAGVFARLSA
ncbi:MAG: polymerase sigma factor [Steroidobacteraceae bacterium]|nr:polymerase sigma factor [Steroidobacteraceae bacterium]